MPGELLLLLLLSPLAALHGSLSVWASRLINHSTPSPTC